MTNTDVPNPEVLVMCVQRPACPPTTPEAR